jgi:hypothetical protein
MTDRTSIRRRARRAGLAVAAAILGLCALGTSAALAQAPLAWQAPTGSDSSSPGALGITAVSCQSSSLCVAVDDAGDVLSTTSPATGVWGTPGEIYPSASHLTGVSCPSATFCIATGKAGDAYSSATPTVQPWTIEAAIDGTTQLNGISCPTTALCVAVDNSGNVLWSPTPGNSASWSTETHAAGNTTALTAVSCPLATLCVATDHAGQVLASTNPTGGSSSWQATTLSTVALNAVSCNSSATCVAVSAGGTVYATADPTTAPVTWTATPIESPGPLAGASCTDAGVCVLVDHGGNAWESDTPIAARPGWTMTSVDSNSPPTLTSVSCLSAGFCVATDVHGYTLSATLPAPAVTTGSGSASSQTTATLNATVNPSDATLSDCHFDYGTTTAYGLSVPCTVVPSATGGTQAVSAQLAGLNASTTYHFRIAASSGVASADGADATFATPAPLKPSPSISGTPAVGNTLSCKPGVSTTAAETVAYQWTSDTVAIAGATSPTYVIVPTEQGHHISCQVTISGDGGSASAISGFDGVPSQTGGTINETFVGTDKRGANSVSAPVTCSSQAPAGCTIKLTLVGIRTAHHLSEKVAVGSVTAKLAAGASKTLSVTLNAAGRMLLRKQHTLAVTLTVSGTVIGTLKATLQTAKLTFTQKGGRLAAHHRR